MPLPSSPSPPGANAPKPIRIFVVDDSDVARRSLVQFLQSLPRVVIAGQATGGLEALAMLEIARADLVLMDLNMPAPDGVATTLRLRKRFDQLKIVLISVNSLPVLEEACQRADADGCLLKQQLTTLLPRALERLFPEKSNLPETPL